MSDNKYKDALLRVMKDYKITAGAVRRMTGLDINETTEDMKKATILLHTMLCETCGRGCIFLEEETSPIEDGDTWSRKAHLAWLSRSKDLAKGHGLDDKNFLFAVTRSISAMEGVTSFPAEILCILILFIKAHLRQGQRVATAPERKDDQERGLLAKSSDQESS